MKERKGSKELALIIHISLLSILTAKEWHSHVSKSKPYTQNHCNSYVFACDLKVISEV